MSEKRKVTVFTIPEAYRVKGQPVKLGMVQLTTKEEANAAERATNRFTLQHEMIKESIRWAQWDGEDGRVINREEGEEEAIFLKLQAPARELIAEVYAELHAASENARGEFQASKEIVYL